MRTNKKTLTIFTPTYNRCTTLIKGYNALLRQTSKDFVWLIVDDGSTDDTCHLVNSWIKENKISIRYFFQENQGMHGAHNTAYKFIDTELNTCIDSDDYMPDDAVERIISFWREHGSSRYAGIIGLDEDNDGNIIGEPFPNDMRSTTLTDYYAHGGKGDKKLVYRTDVINRYPEYPLFDEEKYISLGYKYQLIDQDYQMLTMNVPLVRVEYMADGSSRNMMWQYVQNPKGFTFIRKVSMELAPTWKRRFIEAVHYVAESFLMRNNNLFVESPRKIMTVCAAPFGLALYIYICYKTHGSR